MNMDWKPPWRPVSEKEAQGFLRELRREIGKGHSLHDLTFRVLGRRDDRDDVLLSVEGGAAAWAVVHLTWSGKREARADFPFTSYYHSVAEAFLDE